MIHNAQSKADSRKRRPDVPRILNRKKRYNAIITKMNKYCKSFFPYLFLFSFFCAKCSKTNCNFLPYSIWHFFAFYVII